MNALKEGENQVWSRELVETVFVVVETLRNSRIEGWTAVEPQTE